MDKSFFLAFGLMLVIEGVLPLIAPKAWRQTFQRMVEMKDGQLRFVGMLSLLGGLAIVLFTH
jgi:uncharacterized protein YjeT (DUF2065 family)